jgi:plasmid stabilization system protein ParE
MEAVAHFTLSPAVGAMRDCEPQGTAESARSDGDEARLVPSRTIPLAASRSAPVRRGSIPSIDLSDELRSRLIWLAVETQQSVEEAMTVLLDLYIQWRANEATIETLATILKVAEALEMTTVDVVTLEEYLRARQALAEHNCSFDDVPEALTVLELLEELPVSWDWEQARTAMAAVGTILTSDIALDDVTLFLKRHRRFLELDIDERAAEVIAESLEALAVTGERRPAVIEHIVKGAAGQADVEALQQERRQLQATIDELQANRGGLETRRQELRDDIDALEQHRATIRRQAARLEVECARQETDLAVARGLRNLVLGKKPDVEAFFADLAKLQQWRRAGGSLDDAYGRGVVVDLRTKVVEFVQQLLTENNGS